MNNTLKKWAIIGDVHYSSVSPRKRRDAYGQAILEKVDAILHENDSVFFLGDLVEKPTESLAGFFPLWECLHTWKVQKKDLYFIPGNHDVMKGNIQSLTKGSVGFLMRTGILTCLEKTQDIQGIQVDSIPFVRNVNQQSIERVPDGKDAFLLGHSFFESSLDPLMSLFRQQIEHRNYNYVFLGHDHMPYDPLDLGVTQIHRPGSVCRYKAVSYNLTRSLQYIQLTVDPGAKKIVSLEYKSIPHSPAREVFRPECFEQERTDLKSYEVEIREILESFEPTRTETQSSLRTILLEQQVPENVLRYLEGVHAEVGLSF